MEKNPGMENHEHAHSLKTMFAEQYGIVDEGDIVQLSDLESRMELPEATETTSGKEQTG